VRRGASAALVAAWTLSCFSRPTLVPQLFTIDPPLERPAAPAARRRTLALRRVNVAAPFDGRELVYRTGPYRLERDPYAVLAAPPAALLTEAIRSDLTGSIDDAGAARGAHGPDLLLDVDVGELSGDFVRPEQPAAVLVVTFEVSSPGAASPLFRKVYARRAALTARTAEAVVTAWNEALAQSLRDLERDLDAALSRPSPSSGH
jgi:uncharacterized lipoprotein YmbA